MAICKSRRVSMRICAVRQVDPETLSADPLHIRQADCGLPPHFFYDAGVQGLAFCHKQESQSPSHHHPEHDGAGNNHSRCRHWDEPPLAVDLPPYSRRSPRPVRGFPPAKTIIAESAPFGGGHGAGTLPPAKGTRSLCSRARRTRPVPNTDLIAAAKRDWPPRARSRRRAPRAHSSRSP
jgi:hypothetical protein